MVVSVKWTKRAQSNFDEIVQYIENEWGSKSAQKFVKKVKLLMQTLQNQSEIGKIEIKEKGIRSFVFTRQNTVFYRIKEKNIFILAILIIEEIPKINLTDRMCNSFIPLSH